VVRNARVCGERGGGEIDDGEYDVIDGTNWTLLNRYSESMGEPGHGPRQVDQIGKKDSRRVLVVS
jgi:hypothetical protein